MRYAATMMGALALLALPGAAGAQNAGQGRGSPGVDASSATDRPVSNESASTTPVLLDDPDGGSDGRTGLPVATDAADPDAVPAAPATRRNEREPSANQIYNAARRAEGRIGVRLGDEMGTRVSGQ